METAEIQEITSSTAPTIEGRNFHEVLQSLVGHAVTVINSESYEDAPVGHQIRAGFYPANVAGMGEDFVILAGEFVHSSSGAPSGRPGEPIRQYVPIAHIKRVSILQSERLIHM